MTRNRKIILEVVNSYHINFDSDEFTDKAIEKLSQL
jgi:hypothetical protein